MRVLLVEDAPRLREIVAQRLREEGYATDATDTGMDAIERALATRYDAIVLDLRLPDVDGLDACAELRRCSCWTPILMLTARDALRDRVNGLRARENAVYDLDLRAGTGSRGGIGVGTAPG